MVYFATRSGHVYALDAMGRIIWEYYLEEQVVASPALLADGSLYFVSAQHLWRFVP